MTINKIQLYNFGPFLGKHEIDLTPSENKNIILVGGLNGSGKTSLLNSIQLGFFGKLAVKKVKGSGSYKSIVMDIFNSHAEDKSAYVEIHFQADYQDKKQNFTIMRLWRKTNNGFSEDFFVSNGKERIELNKLLSENWDDYVDQFFPYNISDLFLFDGEKIEQIASYENSNEYIRNSIKSLFGLDILDSTFSDLKILEKRILEEIGKIENDPQFHSALKKLKESEEELDSIIQEKEFLLKKISEIENHLYIQKQNLKAVGGDLYNQKGTLEEEHQVLQKEKEDSINDIISLMNGKLPFLFVQPLLKEILQDGQNNYSKSEIELLKKELNEHENKIFRILKEYGTNESVLQELRNKIIHNTRNQSFPEFRIIDDRGVSYEARKILESCDDTQGEYSRKHNYFKKIDERISMIGERLNNIPSSEKIEPELTKLNILHDEHRAFSIKLNYVNDKIEDLKKQCKQWNDQVLIFTYDDSSNGQSSLLLKKRLIQKIENIKPVIAKFDKEMVNRRISKIENLTLDSIKQLLRKKDFIKDFSINPETFELCIVNSMNEMINLDLLSAGERQILATSLLWGMAKASKQSLPLVIDTPLGRLDSMHRINLINNYFPEGSHQVILLSTDQEISGPYYKEIKKCISKEYTVQFDQDKKTSEIVEGYPFKEIYNESA